MSSYLSVSKSLRSSALPLPFAILIVAAYLAANAEILLSPDVVLATPLGRSYLVHELVHAHQFDGGAPARAPCVGWLEGEAYRVQASYLRTHDLAEDAFAFELLGLLQSACAQSYHP